MITKSRKVLCKKSSWDYAFIFCSSALLNVGVCVLQHCKKKKMLLITICLFYVWLVSFRSIAECWFWTDAFWIVYLCFLIHDCIQSQLVNLRLLLWVFLGQGGVSNGSLSLPLWWTKSDFNAICFRTCVSFFTLHFAFSGNKNASFCFP